MSIQFEPIGYVRTEETSIPRHWSMSDVRGELVIDEKYGNGLKDIKPGQEIVVIFHFHKSPKFSTDKLLQTPPHRGKTLGVFSICSPYRPNPIGLSVLKVLEIKDNRIKVENLDMLNGTPILDIKPHIVSKGDCPSYKGKK